MKNFILENAGVTLILLTLIVVVLLVFFASCIRVWNAESELKEAKEKPYSNPMLPENDYGRLQQESAQLEKARSFRRRVLIISIGVFILCAALFLN